MSKKVYENYDTPSYRNNFKDFLNWRIERSKKRKDYSKRLPQSQSKLISYINENRNDTTITWIGHSTFLIQKSGVNILTDPVYANQMALTKRLSEPGLKIDELPQIDIICISHGHYDHLDFNTLRHSKHTFILAPVGLKHKFTKRGYTNVKEMNWWETYVHFDLNIAFVPAQHWTKRTLFDTNRSHWGGFIFQASDETIYYAGDSAYFTGFKEIGKRFSIDISLLPIGAYEPEWFMKHDHMSPEQAVNAFIDLKANYFIPMHYGAFKLADDTPHEALERLQNSWLKQSLPEDQLMITSLGETIIPSIHLSKKEEAFY